MKTFTTFFGACALSLGMTGAAYAQDASSEHATHHPAPASASDPASKPQMAPGTGMMKNMEAHMSAMDMQAMNGMHQKMAAAQTPEKLQALMADCMKSMPANGAGMQGCHQMMGAMMNPAGDTRPAADHAMSSPPKG